MFVLHVDMAIKPDSREVLKKIYLEIFKPALSAQEGFDSVSLLFPVEKDDEYRLSIAFDQQASQQKWVATDLHQQVWPQMEEQFVRYSVKPFTAF